jgi:hypothetical protein
MYTLKKQIFIYLFILIILICSFMLSKININYNNISKNNVYIDRQSSILCYVISFPDKLNFKFVKKNLERAFPNILIVKQYTPVPINDSRISGSWWPVDLKYYSETMTYIDILRNVSENVELDLYDFVFILEDDVQIIDPYLYPKAWRKDIYEREIIGKKIRYKYSYNEMLLDIINNPTIREDGIVYLGCQYNVGASKYGSVARLYKINDQNNKKLNYNITVETISETSSIRDGNLKIFPIDVSRGAFLSGHAIGWTRKRAKTFWYDLMQYNYGNPSLIYGATDQALLDMQLKSKLNPYCIGTNYLQPQPSNHDFSSSWYGLAYQDRLILRNITLLEENINYF